MKRALTIYFPLLLVISQILGVSLKFSFAQNKIDPTHLDSAASTLATAEFIEIDKIFIIGNRKTKDKIILRELDIDEGDVIDKNQLQTTLDSDKQKIINTRLFLSVDINIIELSDNKADIIIRVDERWYFWPVPIFNLADRNFTEWWVNQNRDLSRVEYGLRLKQYNFRGRNETLSLIAQFGFTKLFGIAYQVPYLDKAQKVGLNIYAEYKANKNIATSTLDHRLQFFDSDVFLREVFRTGAFVTYRPSFYDHHQFGIFQSSASMNDTVPEINPNYFMNGSRTQSYIGLRYSYRIDKRDYVGYPLQGYLFDVDLQQTGLGLYGDVNIFSTRIRYSKYFDLGKNFFFGSGFTGTATFPSSQPYANYNSLGFSKYFLRGYEVYVIEGQHYLINNNSMRYRLFDHEFSLSNFMPIKQFSKFPLAMYLTVNFDQGYVVNYENYDLNKRFTDRYIMGGGLGLDIVTFYDFVMRWEYSWNIDGESSLYLNIGAPF